MPCEPPAAARGGAVLVTGASGFVGGHLAAALAARGERVTCLLRPNSDTRWLPQGLRLERCGLENPVALRRVASGHRVVFHVAGAMRAASPAAYARANVHATETLLRACLEADPPPDRFVLVSSLAAAGPAPHGQRIVETLPARPLTDYGRSKLEAEKRLLAAVRRLRVIILRPGPIYGPRGSEMLAFFRAAARGLLPALGGRAQLHNLAHVDDIVQGLLLAAERPLDSGSVFSLAGPSDRTMAEIAEAFAHAIGRNVRLVPTPRALLTGMALAAEAAARLRGHPAMLCRQKVPELVASWSVDLAAARSRLGYTPRVPIEEGFASTWRWYRERNLL